MGRSRSILDKAVTDLVISDLPALVGGEPRSATQLLRSMTGADLETEVLTILKGSPELQEAESTLNSLIAKYRKAPSVPTLPSDFKLAPYVMEKTLDAVFKQLGDNEADARANNSDLRKLMTSKRATRKAASRAPKRGSCCWRTFRSIRCWWAFPLWPFVAILLTAISGACALIGLARATDAIGIRVKDWTITLSQVMQQT